MIERDVLNDGQVLHHLFAHLEVVKLADVCPTATMNDVLPSSMFMITPALPCRDRRTLLGVTFGGTCNILLGVLALGEATCPVGCTGQALDRVFTGIV